MALIFYSNIERAVLKETLDEIEKGSDRAAAVVAGSFVEQHLESAIKARLVPHDVLTENIFRPSGPLGSLSVKISFGFMIGLYGERARKELDTIRDIRNAFAHKLEIREFTHQRITNLSNNLVFADEVKFYISKPHHMGDISVKIGTQPDDTEDNFIRLIPEELNLNARQRYIRACHLFISGLSLVPRFPPLDYKPLF